MKNLRLFGGVFDYDNISDRLKEIEHELSRPGAWDKPEELTPLLREKSQVEFKLTSYDELSSSRDDVQDWIELAQEDPNEESISALSEQLSVFENRLRSVEMATLFSDPNDKNPAILEIHPGAGGVESQDWAEMLLRMYTRWAERKAFTVKQLDFLPGDEAGIKSVTLQIEGVYAYGQLRGEAGVHRLIRISPFDASGRRHTSFASVDVYPDITEEIEIDVRDEDLRIDVFRSSGPGGQHVNKTNSAVRITHLPTNIVVQCQNEKSQLRNKQTAMMILKARLYEAEQAKLDEGRKKDYASKDSIAWGSQIRTYTLQPYRLVKDHRSNTEISSVDDVLDGDLDELIRSNLLHAHASSHE